MSEKSRILIVDDTPLNIRVLGEALRDEYTVMAATSGASALQLCAREHKPDLILLDVMMPEMDGHEVLRRLQANPSTAGIPVVFVTVLSEEHDEEHGLLLGAVDYITKPFNPALVRARVRNHLELKRHRDHLEFEVHRRTEQLLEMRQDQVRLEGELETARRLQLSMLRERTFALGERGELVAFLNPARTVGGDLFDYALVEDDKALFCLGDVSDKGTSAALFMVKTLTLFRAFLESEVQPNKLLEKVNRSLCQFNDEYMFVTLTCCLLELSTGEFCWASGGHEPLLKFGPNRGEYLPQDNGPALGLSEDAEFPLQRDRLLPGEGLVLYSDGITEAQADDGVQFGEQRLLAALQELPDPSPQELCDQLLDKVGAFVRGAEQFDDMVVLAVGWNQPNP